MLTDFGLARSPYQLKLKPEVPALDELEGTTPWLAYELLEIAEGSGGIGISRPDYTKACDMWSFGMVVYVRGDARFTTQNTNNVGF